jgi:hypothetical protein
MFSRKKVRLVVSFASVGFLTLVSATSDAGRSVRSDASDGAFNFLGGFWGDNAQQFGAPGFGARSEFKLNLGNAAGARYYRICMSEDGFIKLSAASSCVDTDYALPPTGNYIAVFATDLDSTSAGFGSLIRTRGFVDTRTTYRLPEAAPAMRFWWNAVTLAGDGTLSTFDVQIVLIDRSKGSNNGDFDLEFNYGNGEQIPPVGTEANPNANGFQGFKLGPNSRTPRFGPFGPFDQDGSPIRFCFRGGTRTSC